MAAQFVHQGLASEAVNGARLSRHDGAEAAFAARRTSGSKVGDLNGLLADELSRSGAMMASWRVSLNANPLLLVFDVSSLNPSQQLLLDVVGELESQRVVLVSKLLANVARISPG